MCSFDIYKAFYGIFANPPATWGEVGLRTIDQTPVAGSVKAAIESDNWVDAASNSLNALGSGILIGVGGYKALSGPKAGPVVYYVDPNGVTIASKWGVPSEGAFSTSILGEINGGADVVSKGGYFSTYRHPLLFKKKKAIQWIEELSNPNLKGIAEILHNTKIKSMSISRHLLYKQTGLYIPSKNTILVYCPTRTTTGVARTLIHEAYHKYCYLFAKEYATKSGPAGDLGLRLMYEFPKWGYRGTLEYRAYKFTGESMGFSAIGRGPYRRALQGYDVFKLHIKNIGQFTPYDPALYDPGIPKYPIQ